MGALIGQIHTEHEIRSAEQVTALRSRVRELCAEHRGSATLSGRAELIASELGNNLLSHTAEGGLALLKATSDPSIEMIFIGSPGSAPRKGLGIGLKSVEELATEVDCFEDERGRVTVARVFAEAPPASDLDFAAIALPYAPGLPSGDLYALDTDDTEDNASILVVDGLGHGEPAHVASSRLGDCFAEGSVTPDAFFRMAPGFAKGTRGAVAALARLEPGRLIYGGVGNISGRYRAEGAWKGLVSKAGMIGGGSRLTQPILTEAPWERGSLLVMWSDGLRSRWKSQDYPKELWDKAPLTIAGVLCRDMRRKDDATIVVARQR